MMQEGGLRIQGIVKKPEPGLPLVSIVTVCLNSGDAIHTAISSVASQDYANIEYIVIDGGSTDGTLDVIRRCGGIDYWRSEPDAGIADAFNKGIGFSSGELIGILNADDAYHPDSVSSAVASYLEGDGESIVHGSMTGVFGEREVLFAPRPFPGLFFYIDMPVYHPTAFVPRGVYERVGLYDCSYRYAMDYEFFLRAHRSGVKFSDTGRNMIRYSFSGKSGSSPVSAYRDVIRAQRKHGLCLPACAVTFALKVALSRTVNFFRK